VTLAALDLDESLTPRDMQHLRECNPDLPLANKAAEGRVRLLLGAKKTA